jgi:hypothetical protein
VSAAAHDVPNDAPRIVFATREAAEQEALLLFERRKNPQYLMMLLCIQLQAGLRRMRAIDESNLTFEERDQHRKDLTRMTKDITEVLMTAGSWCTPGGLGMGSRPHRATSYSSGLSPWG